MKKQISEELIITYIALPELEKNYTEKLEKLRFELRDDPELRGLILQSLTR